MFNAFHIISSCSEIPYRHRFAAWVPKTCHNNFPVLFWRRNSWQKGNTNLLQVNHKNTNVRQKSIDKKYLRMHIQPELDTIPKRVWHNSWTHTVFLGKPALGRKRKILTLSAIVINSESFKHRNCSMLSEDFSTYTKYILQRETTIIWYYLLTKITSTSKYATSYLSSREVLNFLFRIFQRLIFIPVLFILLHLKISLDIITCDTIL